jgi:hypothetical protein
MPSALPPLRQNISKNSNLKDRHSDRFPFGLDQTHSTIKTVDDPTPSIETNRNEFLARFQGKSIKINKKGGLHDVFSNTLVPIKP